VLRNATTTSSSSSKARTVPPSGPSVSGALVGGRACNRKRLAPSHPPLGHLIFATRATYGSLLPTLQFTSGGGEEGYGYVSDLYLSAATLGVAVAWTPGRGADPVAASNSTPPCVSACSRVWPRAGLPLGLGPSSLPKQKQCGRPRRLGPVAVGARCALGNLRASPGRRKATRPALRRRLALSVWVWITNWWLSCPALQSGGRWTPSFLPFRPRLHAVQSVTGSPVSSNCAGTDLGVFKKYGNRWYPSGLINQISVRLGSVGFFRRS